jgi:hypothetical protein
LFCFPKPIISVISDHHHHHQAKRVRLNVQRDFLYTPADLGIFSGMAGQAERGILPNTGVLQA